MSAVRPGRVAVLGAGPAGMAAALSLRQAGHEVSLIERYKEARPAGNILNLWPPPIKALGLMGVDVTDFGAPCQSEFRNATGKVRAVVNLPQDVVDSYGGGFIGLLRPELYERLLAALPAGTLQVNREVASFNQDGTGVTLRFADGTTETYDVLVARTASTPWSVARCGATSPSGSTTCTSSAGSRSPTTWTSSPAAASSPTTAPPRAAGPRSATRGAPGSSGGCSRPTTPTRSSRATSTRPPPSSPRRSPTRCRTWWPPPRPVTCSGG